ncbi:MAG: hypothetical protein L0229_25380 [Blastocatellia bacterium]|nr:hypothetical protein [Blastocatellia bacterium]
MRKYTFALLTFALLTLILTVVRAVAPSYQEEKPMQKATRAYTGKVLSVDSSQSRIVISDEKSATEMTLLINANTKITKGGKPITLAEIKDNDVVAGECEESENGCIATSIKVTEAKPDSQ